ncbi:CoA pyrophosphatase [Altererythrobacter arenosus]|uniref:CoA pyrophosphatase n=1 Tax=Altererythrobacter arenosus TaxID=3032592 RepID=A0ABY8FT12_9SPHN|nr:CoA pyrophosphatase [Altererythrobacter sp. CAU 1644]WFL77902.1 CoA pyrophosphatase [Altererythrobacter sp. CAU 1644]
MSPLFDRLSALLEEGHQKPVGNLITDERFALADRNADAAVLIAVTERDDPGVILTQRPRDMRDHPGQVALPGGKVDPGEDAIQAALREAHEEIDLDPGHVRVIGTTDRYQTGTGFNVTPVLGVIPPDLPLIAHPQEVESWFEAPLSLLLRPDSWTEQEAYWRGEMRKYLEMDYQGYRIWGVTAAILWNLSQRIAHEGLFDGG